MEASIVMLVMITSCCDAYDDAINSGLHFGKVRRLNWQFVANWILGYDGFVTVRDALRLRIAQDAPDKGELDPHRMLIRLPQRRGLSRRKSLIGALTPLAISRVDDSVHGRRPDAAIIPVSQLIGGCYG